MRSVCDNEESQIREKYHIPLAGFEPTVDGRKNVDFTIEKASG